MELSPGPPAGPENINHPQQQNVFADDPSESHTLALKG
jgi:hypothetical protein